MRETVKGIRFYREAMETLNLFQYACYLTARTPRIECKQDGVLQADVPWARPEADFTLPFESLAMTLCREMPVDTVSRIIGEDDNKLWRMIHCYVEKARACEDYSSVSSMGIDETSAKRGHDYVTLVVDLEARKTIFVTQGKDSSAIERFKEDLIVHHGSPECIASVSIDMSYKGNGRQFPPHGYYL